MIVGIVMALSLGWATTKSYAATESAYQGRWDFVSTGDDQAAGEAIVDAGGNITGAGTTGRGLAISLSGVVRADGSFEFDASPTGSVSSGATFTGKVNGPNSASGTWMNQGLSGRWTATLTSDSVPDLQPPPDPRTGGAGTGAGGWRFRSPNSGITCEIADALRPWTWRNRVDGIRFRWTKAGRFELETENYPDVRARSYANIKVALRNVMSSTQSGVLSKADKRLNSYVLDVSVFNQTRQPPHNGPITFAQLTLGDGTVAFKRAVGEVNFDVEGRSSRCTFDLQTR